MKNDEKMKQDNYITEIVNRIPKDEDLKDGILYVALYCAVAVHKCMCGCGEKVVTPLNVDKNKFDNAWDWNYDEKTVSLSPSVGNFQQPCKSHYFLKNGIVQWVK